MMNRVENRIEWNGKGGDGVDDESSGIDESNRVESSEWSGIEWSGIEWSGIEWSGVDGIEWNESMNRVE